jgi:hypothetical protein
LFEDTAGSDVDAYIVNNASGLFIGKTNSPSASNDIVSIDLSTGGVVFNEASNDADLRVESNGNTHMLFVDGGNDAVGIGVSDVTDAQLVIRSTGVDGTYNNVLSAQYSGNSNEHNVIGTTVSSTAANSGFIFKVSDGGGSTGTTEVLKLTRAGAIFNDASGDQDFRVESNADANAFFVNGGDGVVSFGGMGTNTRSPSSVEPKFQANSLTRMDSSISLCCNSNDALASLLMFSKTRSGNLTGATVCQAGDAVGAITWNAADGTDIDHGIAAIDAVVESGIGTNDTPGAIRFYTNSGTTAASERVRITGSGSLLVNETTPTAMVNVTNNNQAASTLLALEDKGGTGAHTQISFSNTNGQVGTINTSGSATAYNTSSDYRLKENITDLTGATDRLKQLAPKRFNFLNDADTTVDGFIAHEVSSIVPEAITGEKDEVDDNGDPVYQGIDQSKLVPLLVATIQELEARIAALESK